MSVEVIKFGYFVHKFAICINTCEFSTFISKQYPMPEKREMLNIYDARSIKSLLNRHNIFNTFFCKSFAAFSR